MTKKAAKWWLAGSSVLLVAFYILSPGPVLRMIDSGSLGGTMVENILEVIYFPLEWLYRHVPIVEDFYDWWFRLWGA